MVKLLNWWLSKLGFAIYSRKKVNYYPTDQLIKMYNVDDYDLAYIKGKLDGGFKEKLIKENKTRWLDVGCGGNFEDNFYYLDTFAEGIVCNKEKYFRADIVNLSNNDIEKLGKFDLIRMQHCFEHFTPENGVVVLKNCAKLLKEGGYILISTPDLKRYVHLYLSNKINENFDWALNRIDKNSPNSFYFSIFSHSMVYEKHEWCYDAEGLIYQLNRSDKFKNIVEITLNDKLANIPFTHNRPEQDVCVLAQLR